MLQSSKGTVVFVKTEWLFRLEIDWFVLYQAGRAIENIFLTVASPRLRDETDWALYLYVLTLCFHTAL